MNLFDSLCKGCSMRLMGCLLPLTGFLLALVAFGIVVTVMGDTMLGVVLGMVVLVAIFAVTFWLMKRLSKAIEEEKKNSKY